MHRYLHHLYLRNLWLHRAGDLGSMGGRLHGVYARAMTSAHAEGLMQSGVAANANKGSNITVRGQNATADEELNDEQRNGENWRALKPLLAAYIDMAALPADVPVPYRTA